MVQCWLTQKKCKQPAVCDARGCFKERLGSINLHNFSDGYVPPDSERHKSDKDLVKRDY